MTSNTQLTLEKKISIFFSNLAGVTEHIGKEHEINDLKKNLEHAHANNATTDEYIEIISQAEILYCRFRHEQTLWNPLTEDFKEFKAHPEKLFIWEDSCMYPDEEGIRQWITS